MRDHGVAITDTIDGSDTDTIDGSDLVADVTELSAVDCGRRMTADLLKRQPDIDCIYFSNDDLAFGGLCHCIAAGIDVPGDVALAGFNGLGIIEGFPGKIASSRTARKKIGEQAARMILETLENTTAEMDKLHILKPEISLGELAASNNKID